MQHHKKLTEEQTEAKKWRQIVFNIDAYDGTERGQKEIEEK